MRQVNCRMHTCITFSCVGLLAIYKIIVLFIVSLFVLLSEYCMRNIFNFIFTFIWGWMPSLKLTHTRPGAREVVLFCSVFNDMDTHIISHSFRSDGK